MNILFVFSVQEYIRPAKPLYSQEKIALGISYVSSTLKSAGHSTHLVVLTAETPMHVLDRAIEDLQPQLVCFSAVFSEYPLIVRCAAHIRKRHPGLYLLVGGAHVSLNPEAALKDGFSAVCIGEGEFPTLELVQHLETGQTPHAIPNLWIKHGNAVEKNPPREFLQDLDCLPFPDRDMWQPWIENPNTFPCVLLGRGCVYDCTYCFNHALKSVAPGQYLRLRSPSNVAAEIEELLAQRPDIDHVYLEAETIGTDLDFVVKLCGLLKELNSRRTCPVTFGTNLRVTPNRDFGPLFAALRDASFAFINIGLESGSPRVREESLNRYYSNQDIIRAVSSAREHGLRVHLFALMGIPGETYEDFQETLGCVRVCQPDDVFLSIFTPYPGSVLHRICEEQGLITGNLDMRLQRRHAILDLPGFSKRQIQREFRLFSYKVYKGRRPLSVNLRQVAREWLWSSYRLNRIYQMYKRYSIFRR